MGITNGRISPSFIGVLFVTARAKLNLVLTLFHLICILSLFLTSLYTSYFLFRFLFNLEFHYAERERGPFFLWRSKNEVEAVV